MNGTEWGIAIVTALLTAFLVRLFGGGREHPNSLRLEAKVDALLQHSGVAVKLEASPAVVEMVQKGREIDAIRLYREATGVGLKEAKAAIDAIARDLKRGKTG